MPMNIILVQINRVTYKLVNTIPNVETITEDELKSSFIGIKRKTRGQTKRKNNSSRSKLTNIIVVLRPALIPSFAKNITTKLDPPTTAGVTAEVNSLSTLI
jgi:hypothetical protein